MCMSDGQLYPMIPCTTRDLFNFEGNNYKSYEVNGQGMLLMKIATDCLYDLIGKTQYQSTAFGSNQFIVGGTTLFFDPNTSTVSDGQNEYNVITPSRSSIYIRDVGNGMSFAANKCGNLEVIILVCDTSYMFICNGQSKIISACDEGNWNINGINIKYVKGCWTVGGNPGVFNPTTEKVMNSITNYSWSITYVNSGSSTSTSNQNVRENVDTGSSNDVKESVNTNGGVTTTVTKVTTTTTKVTGANQNVKNQEKSTGSANVVDKSGTITETSDSTSTSTHHKTEGTQTHVSGTETQVNKGTITQGGQTTIKQVTQTNGSNTENKETHQQTTDQTTVNKQTEDKEIVNQKILEQQILEQKILEQKNLAQQILEQQILEKQRLEKQTSEQQFENKQTSSHESGTFTKETAQHVTKDLETTSNQNGKVTVNNQNDYESIDVTKNQKQENVETTGTGVHEVITSGECNVCGKRGKRDADNNNSNINISNDENCRQLVIEFINHIRSYFSENSQSGCVVPQKPQQLQYPQTYPQAGYWSIAYAPYPYPGFQQPYPGFQQPYPGVQQPGPHPGQQPDQQPDQQSGQNTFALILKKMESPDFFSAKVITCVSSRIVNFNSNYKFYSSHRFSNFP